MNKSLKFNYESQIKSLEIKNVVGPAINVMCIIIIHNHYYLQSTKSITISSIYLITLSVKDELAIVMFISGVTNVIYKSNNVIKWKKLYIINDVYVNVSRELVDWFLKSIMELAMYIDNTTSNLVAHWYII